MSNQPYEGHGAHHRQPAPQPRYEDVVPAPQDDHTQRWEGQTWETQVQPPVTAADLAETAYLPPQTGADPVYGHGHAAPDPYGHAGQQAAQGGQGYGDGQGYGGPSGSGHPHSAPQTTYGQQASYGRQAPASYGQQAPYQQASYQQASYQQVSYGRQVSYGGQAGQPGGFGGPAAHGQPADSGHAQQYAGTGGPYGAPYGGTGQYGVTGQALPPEAPAGTAGHPAPQVPHPAAAHAAPAPAEPAAPGTDGGPAYGPPTLTGNARITDAQRARAEGRSPIIEPGIQPAALTAVLGLLLSGAAAIGSYALLVPLVLLQAVTAAGWFRLNGMWPARQGIALAFLGALVADAALLAAGREHGPAAILGALGVWVLLSLVLQLRSHADPDERMYGLMATVASAALSIIAAGHLAAVPDAVTTGAAAVAVGILVRALPLPTPVSVVVSLLAAAAAGWVVGGMTDLGTGGALLGAGAGLCALIGHRVAAYDYPSRFVHMTAGVALPLAAAAPAVYLLGRALV
ncbi:hypothetical protein GCM10010358_60680 [Streptomyces minutiscleroticus]|uniref:Uncharacterized protein n=1 Tax=Streptomyces minutiscleroticus TaxID=68238 RepID=A0A918NW93_9ACTN|nr:hypothetical protein [Streptomyces minutiscleroticus]GGX98870.1 hypothetical protein GCM10010358_60680 [Streptomyces minutiscleroticus]